MDDDARRIILARRARFVAATLAGVGLAQGCASQSGTCLSRPVIEIDGGATEPEEQGDAAVASEPGNEPGSEADAEPEPQVCLEVAEPPPRTPPKAPPPRICLSEY